MAEIAFQSRHREGGRILLVVEEGGHTVWAYLTEPDGRPARDAVVASRVDPIAREEVAKYAKTGGPPPVAQGFLNAEFQRTGDLGEIDVKWSQDGASTCVYVQQVPVAVLSMSFPKGMSRAIAKDGPWGSRWSDVEFERLFP